MPAEHNRVPPVVRQTAKRVHVSTAIVQGICPKHPLPRQRRSGEAPTVRTSHAQSALPDARGKSMASVMLSAWLIVLWRRPVFLLRLNEQLRQYADIKLSWTPVSITLPFRHLLHLQVFHYHSRVLDAWVQARVSTARTQFSSIPTVRAGQVHIPVFSRLDQKLVPELRGETLRTVFARQIACLLISGEGGAGKTSLACVIGRWALSDDPRERPAKQLMVPVLIEDEITGDFLDAVRRHLQILVDEPDMISEELCHLLSPDAPRACDRGSLFGAKRRDTRENCA